MKNMENIFDRLINADENALSPVDRLGLAYVRLNFGCWDPILGPIPSALDPVKLVEDSGPVTFGINETFQPLMDAIESIIGEAACSRAFYICITGKTEADWFRWYVVERTGFCRPKETKPIKLSQCSPKEALKAKLRQLWKK